MSAPTLRQALLGWLIVAVCLILVGAGTIVGAGVTRRSSVPAATIAEWRQYAADVESGRRTPLPATTRMLTETAIAQHQYANATQQLLRYVGAAVVLLGLFLAVDLGRYRARYLRPGGADGG